MNENTSTANAGRKKENSNATSLEEKRKKYNELKVKKTSNNEVDSWLKKFSNSVSVNFLICDFETNLRTNPEDDPIRVSSSDSIKMDLEELTPFVSAHVILEAQRPIINRKRKAYSKKRAEELEDLKRKEEVELEKNKREAEAEAEEKTDGNSNNTFDIDEDFLNE